MPKKKKRGMAKHYTRKVGKGARAAPVPRGVKTTGPRKGPKRRKL